MPVAGSAGYGHTHEICQLPFSFFNAQRRRSRRWALRESGIASFVYPILCLTPAKPASGIGYLKFPEQHYSFLRPTPAVRALVVKKVLEQSHLIHSQNIYNCIFTLYRVILYTRERHHTFLCKRICRAARRTPDFLFYHCFFAPNPVYWTQGGSRRCIWR